jgi:hypothetical protein
VRHTLRLYRLIPRPLPQAVSMAPAP